MNYQNLVSVLSAEAEGSGKLKCPKKISTFWKTRTKTITSHLFSFYINAVYLSVISGQLVDILNAPRVDEIEKFFK